jgi:hypothetical protein
MSQPTVSGVARTTGITLSDEEIGENARSAAVMHVLLVICGVPTRDA